MDSKNQNAEGVRILIKYLLVALLIGAIIFVFFLGIQGLEMLNSVDDIKADIGIIAQNMLSFDTADAEASVLKLDQDVADVRDKLDTRLWTFAADISVLTDDLVSADYAMSILQYVSDEMLKPIIGIMNDYPVKENLMNPGAITEETIGVYIRVYREMYSKFHVVTDALGQMRFHLADYNGSISKLLGQVQVIGEALDILTADVAEPLFIQLQATPITSILTEEGLNKSAVNSYISFYPILLSSLQNFTKELNAVDLSEIDRDHSIEYAIGEVTKVENVLTESSVQVILPVIQQLMDHPVDAVFSEDGINMEELQNYIEFYKSIMPQLKQFAEYLPTADLGVLNEDGKLTKYIDLFVQGEALLEKAANDIIDPILLQLENHPLDQLAANVSVDTLMNMEGSEMESYLEFYKQYLPQVRTFTDEVQAMDLSQIDSTGKLSDLVDKCIGLEDVIEQADQMIISNVITEIESNPITSLKTEEGFNVRLIDHYLNYAEELLPKLQEFRSYLDTVDTSRVLFGSKIDVVKGKIDEIAALYAGVEQHLPLVHTVLGGGEDRFYLVVAQNSAEIRGAGGFPGTIGSVSIVNGYLKIGTFEAPGTVFAKPTPDAARISNLERSVFTPNLSVAWDASYMSHFPRVAEIWKISYEAKMGTRVDGVFSVTPAIIQELLKVVGPIDVDGRILDGTNATNYLQNGIYKEFLYRGSSLETGNSQCDYMFTQIAYKTIDKVFGSMGLSEILGYLEVYENGVANRTIMMWFPNAEEQQTVKNAGATGALNDDPYHPQAGVYMGGSDACKLGWYVDIVPEILGNTANPDGSVTYDIRVSFYNRITDADIQQCSEYILGHYGGEYLCYVHFYAPAGGKITGFRSNRGMQFFDQYQGLEVYHFETVLLRNEPLVATYQITTAPGVSTPLTFDVTPTLTEYRNA